MSDDSCSFQGTANIWHEKLDTHVSYRTSYNEQRG